MTRLALHLDDLVVTSFATQAAAPGPGATVCTADISTCPRTSPDGGCVCTADISTCPRTIPDSGCPFTGDYITCPRTQICID